MDYIVNGACSGLAVKGRIERSIVRIPATDIRRASFHNDLLH